MNMAEVSEFAAPSSMFEWTEIWGDALHNENDAASKITPTTPQTKSVVRVNVERLSR